MVGCNCGAIHYSSFHSKGLHAPMVMSGLWEAPTTVVVWKCAIKMPGGLSVKISGTLWTLLSSAASLDCLLPVRIILYCYYYGVTLHIYIYTAASTLPSTETVDGSGPIWLNNVECTYEDTRLIDCFGGRPGLMHALHAQDVGVSCPGNYTP